MPNKVKASGTENHVNRITYYLSFISGIKLNAYAITNPYSMAHITYFCLA